MKTMFIYCDWTDLVLIIVWTICMCFGVITTVFRFIFRVIREVKSDDKKTHSDQNSRS